MKTGFKVAAAGLAVVLGCTAVALSPLEIPLVDGAAAPVSATAQDAASLVSGSTAIDAASSSIHRSGPAEEDPAATSTFRDPASGTLYRDGTYRASVMGRQGFVPVTVTVSRGTITKIVVGQNSEVAAMAEKAQETVIPQILESQSVEGIDLATGATVTSEAIVAGVAEALSYAVVA